MDSPMKIGAQGYQSKNALLTIARDQNTVMIEIAIIIVGVKMYRKPVNTVDLIVR